VPSTENGGDQNKTWSLATNCVGQEKYPWQDKSEIKEHLGVDQRLYTHARARTHTHTHTYTHTHTSIYTQIYRH
jgi:hypothetical protein